MLHTMLLKHPSTEILFTCITFVILLLLGLKNYTTIDCQERSNLNTLGIIKLRPIYLYIYTFLFYLVGVCCTVIQMVQSLHSSVFRNLKIQTGIYFQFIYISYIIFIVTKLILSYLDRLYQSYQ